MLKRTVPFVGREQCDETTFSLQLVSETDWRVMVTETVPGHGHRRDLIGPVFRDLQNIDEAFAFADLLIVYCVEREWIPARWRAAKKVLLALEVIRRLKPDFQLTGLALVLWARRDISGDDLIREANPK